MEGLFFDTKKEIVPIWKISHINPVREVRKAKPLAKGEGRNEWSVFIFEVCTGYHTLQSIEYATQQKAEAAMIGLMNRMREFADGA